MNGSGRQFFSGAGFPGEQYRDIALCSQSEPAKHLLHRRAFADELEAGKDAGISSRSQALINVSQAFDLVVQASHNPYVNKTVGIVRAMSRRFWIYHLKRHDYAPAAQAYVRLLRAVAAGQPDEAAAASDALIDYLEAFARQNEDWT